MLLLHVTVGNRLQSPPGRERVRMSSSPRKRRRKSRSRRHQPPHGQAPSPSTGSSVQQSAPHAVPLAPTVPYGIPCRPHSGPYGVAPFYGAQGGWHFYPAPGQHGAHRGRVLNGRGRGRSALAPNVVGGTLTGHVHALGIGAPSSASQASSSSNGRGRRGGRRGGRANRSPHHPDEDGSATTRKRRCGFTAG